MSSQVAVHLRRCSPLRAELFLHQRRGLGLDVHQIKEGLHLLTCGLGSPPT